MTKARAGLSVQDSAPRNLIFGEDAVARLAEAFGEAQVRPWSFTFVIEISEFQKTVIITAGDDRREMVREALTYLGSELQIRLTQVKKIFIHPNLVTHFREAAATSVEAVRGVVHHISLVRNDEILIGDAGFHDTKKAFRKYNYESLARSGNIKLIDLNDDQTIESFAYTADLQKRPLGFSKTVADSDFNIVVVPAKMHSYYIVSLSIKTQVVGSEVVPRSPFGIHARWPWLHTGHRSAHLTFCEFA